MTAKTDRELLELAAKACGMPYWEHYDESNAALIVPAAEDGVAEEWNPLADDGDALRLAVKLMMTVRALKNVSTAEAFNGFGEFREYGDDQARNTRYAIVHAAAKIGEKS